MAIPTFNIPWIGAKRFSIKFKTNIDNEYTGDEQRDAQWTNPQYGWHLKVEKKPANFTALMNFFVLQKARWKKFYWTWDISKEGDGVTYLVRFDHSNDELVFEEDDKYWIVPIVQVKQ